VSPTSADPIAALPGEELATLRAIADQLIPAAGEMPAAGGVLSDARLRFVLNARPDLLGPLHRSLRGELGEDIAMRLDVLGRDEPSTLGALQLVIVAGYYTDAQVRDLIGYPGQMALDLRTFGYPAYLDEGLIDAVLARGATWRDPSTGRRAVVEGGPRTYAERFADLAEAPGASAPAPAAAPEGGT
jgi:hypothetical protein